LARDQADHRNHQRAAQNQTLPRFHTPPPGVDPLTGPFLQAGAPEPPATPARRPPAHASAPRASRRHRRPVAVLFYCGSLRGSASTVIVGGGRAGISRTSSPSSPARAFLQPPHWREPSRPGESPAPSPGAPPAPPASAGS